MPGLQVLTTLLYLGAQARIWNSAGLWESRCHPPKQQSTPQKSWEIRGVVLGGNSLTVMTVEAQEHIHITVSILPMRPLTSCQRTLN